MWNAQLPSINSTKVKLCTLAYSAFRADGKNVNLVEFFLLRTVMFESYSASSSSTDPICSMRKTGTSTVQLGACIPASLYTYMHTIPRTLRVKTWGSRTLRRTSSAADQRRSAVHIINTVYGYEFMWYIEFCTANAHVWACEMHMDTTHSYGRCSCCANLYRNLIVHCNWRFIIYIHIRVTALPPLVRRLYTVAQWESESMRPICMCITITSHHSALVHQIVALFLHPALWDCACIAWRHVASTKSAERETTPQAVSNVVGALLTHNC